MGKYIRKGKGIGKVAVMEVSQAGVRTRARALAALQKDRKLAPTKSSSAAKNHDYGNRLKPSCLDSMQISYLELRSRRLQKGFGCYPKERSAIPASNTATTDKKDEDPRTKGEEEMESSRLIRSEDPTNQSFSHRSNSCREAVTVKKVPEFSAGSSRTRAVSTMANSRTDSGAFSRSNSRARSRSRRLRKGEENTVEIKHVDPPSEGIQYINDEAIMEMEASFGENVMDNDTRERRETTPSSNRRGEAEILESPGSTTRRARPGRVQNEARMMRLCNGPTSQEIDEFFAGAEEQEHRRFAERYNYDTLNDAPLPGRFDWVMLRP